MTPKKYLEQSTVTNSEVKAWTEEVYIPTYEVGKEEKNPIFLEKRVYQGSSGSVYPYPVIEKISDSKHDVAYTALFIENEYIKVMILPQLGGRVQMAYDKIRQRHFVYYNQVIKPALVGLTGPWISGGIEFNWPQHHRPSTFLPTEWSIENHPDGSKTVWCNEVERMFGTKGKHGFRLYPSKAYIEIDVQIYNRTPLPQTFLWWANPAVSVNDNYHSVFPTDVHAVFDHGKRDVSDFPIATGTYYKADYLAGVDISRYKNIPVPTSFMAIESDYDFVGGYDEAVEAGLLHVANHHISPGKKQWTWGNSDFGQAWDRNLTDEDGPYIELMTGVFTDNQPDFSWLQPYEEKSWKQYFMPYSKAGYVKNATKDFIISVIANSETTKGVIYTTGINRHLRIILSNTDDEIIFEQISDINPANPYIFDSKTPINQQYKLKLSVYSSDGKLLVSWQNQKPEPKLKPEPAKAAIKPNEIESIEQLFLTGLHLEQYRHATYNATDYYNEALSRQPSDVRCNNAMGLNYLRKGKFEEALIHFRTAIETITQRNPNPYDGEPFFNLGICLTMLERHNEAYSAFYKAAWNDAWQAASYYNIALIDCKRENYDDALYHINKALIKNYHNHKARQLKASILRKIGKIAEAEKWIEESIAIDSFNLGIIFEKYFLTKNPQIIELIKARKVNNFAYFDYIMDFVRAGLIIEAIEIIELINNELPNTMLAYTLGYCYKMQGETDKAKKQFAKAEKLSPNYVFPNKIDELMVLKCAFNLNPDGAKTPYYIGNFYYAARMYSDAIHYWQISAQQNPQFPTVLRNLALAAYNKQNDKALAVELLEKAFSLDTADDRILMELDQLYKRLQRSCSFRLSFLEKYSQLVNLRDDLCVERITLHNSLELFEQADKLIASRKFHPWEGGEGKITTQYVFTRIQLAKKAIANGNALQAIELLESAKKYPQNLGEGKLPITNDNDLFYYLGIAQQLAGNSHDANTNFRLATNGESEPTQAFFYNDPQPDKIYFQGLAWQALGNRTEAESCFAKLIRHGENHLNDTVRIDYFAVSLPDLAIWDDNLQTRNAIHCNYVIGLGNAGLGNFAKAIFYFDQVLLLDINHQGAQTVKNDLMRNKKNGKN